MGKVNISLAAALGGALAARAAAGARPKPAGGNAGPAAVVVQGRVVDVPDAQRARFAYVVAKVPHPQQEAEVRGEVVGHLAARKLARWEDYARRGNLSDEGAAALEWFARRSALAIQGAYQLRALGAGRAARSADHAPRPEAIGAARLDVSRARAAIRPAARLVFDQVMDQDMTFTECADLVARLGETHGRGGRPLSGERERKRLAALFALAVVDLVCWRRERAVPVARAA